MSREPCLLGCIVEQCPNNPKRKKLHTNEARFYSFPDDPIWKKKWVEILCLVGYNNKKNANICSIHFLEYDFEVNEVRKFLLKRTAIPSVNLDLTLLGNKVGVVNIATTEDTLSVGVSTNKTCELENMCKNFEYVDFSYDFLNTLKKSFSNTEYCKDYSSQLISTCNDDNSLENVITAAKKNQINILKDLKICNFNYKQQRLYLYKQEEKNQTYAKIKTPCFGRCRLCLYCFKHSELLLFSSQHSISNKDVTIRDCLMSLFPSLSDNFEPNHEICVTCYDHLLTTLHFFKMTLTVEGLLNTILKNQPFIFNAGKQETEPVLPIRKVELEKGNKNTSPTCLNDTLYCFSDMGNNREVSTPIEPIFNEAPHSIPNNFKDTADSIESQATKKCDEENQITNILHDQQKDIISKNITLLAPIKSADDLVSLGASSNSALYNNKFNDMIDYKQVSSYLLGINHGNGFNEPQENQLDQINTESESDVVPYNFGTDGFVSFPADFSERHESNFDSSNGNDSHLKDLSFINIKSDVEVTNLLGAIKSEETDLIDMDQYIKPDDNMKCKDLCTLNNEVNSGNSYVNDDFIMSDNDNSTEKKYSVGYVSSAHSGVDLNMSVTESILRSEFNNISGSFPSLTVITPPMLNLEGITADFIKNLKFISLDFNMTEKKRIIFLGGTYCERCMKTKVACRCPRLSNRRKPIICEKCGKKLTGWSLRRHALICQPGSSFTCEKCNATFSSKSKYATHLKKIADAPVCNYFKCKICLVKFTGTDFKEHILEHPNYLCQICGKSFMCYNQLYVHVRSHDYDPKQEEVVCQFCGKLVSTRGYTLKNHLKGHKVQEKGKKETCDICNKMFYTKRDVRKHKLNTHTGNKYQCDLCDKEFSSPLGLKSHTQVVHIKKPIASCEICKLEFARHDYYRFHIRVHHAGNGPPMATSTRVPGGPKRKIGENHPSRHKCGLCNMTFQNVGNRERHEKLHENPYYQFGCKICHARNKSEEQLQRHMEKSHSKIPNKIYQCYHCNEQFNKKYFLQNHMRNVHSRVQTGGEDRAKSGNERNETVNKSVI